MKAASAVTRENCFEETSRGENETVSILCDCGLADNGPEARQHCTVSPPYSNPHSQNLLF
jgi:hypothetical protein